MRFEKSDMEFIMISLLRMEILLNGQKKQVPERIRIYVL